MSHAQKKIRLKQKTKSLRVRKRLRGTSLKPRLCVIKSNKNIYAQLIDDENGITLGSASTLAKGAKQTELAKKNTQSAKEIGIRIAGLAKEKNIEQAIFDRGRFKYHGILAEVAEGARSSGLKI